MIAAMMLLGTSTAFAGDSDALKAILKAKGYAEAASLVNLLSLNSHLMQRKPRLTTIWYNSLWRNSITKLPSRQKIKQQN